MRKKYYIKIEIELHAVTCPGVWLCTNGGIEIIIKTLGYVFKTGQLEPKFPLLCHDLFRIEGYYTPIELDKSLCSEDIEISMWQNGRRLSDFHGKLGQILRNSSLIKTYLHDLNVQILLKPSPNFPGIIAPKIELTTRAIAMDQNSAEIQTDLTQVNPFCIKETNCKFQENCHSHKVIRRQKPVCHMKRNFSRVYNGNVIPWGNKHSKCCKSSDGCCDNGTHNISSISFTSSQSNSGHLDCSTENYKKSSSASSLDSSKKNVCNFKSINHKENCYICKTYETEFGI